MIYCIGDSFTFGAELPDVLHGGSVPSQFAWPGILEKQINQKVYNLGKQACSNNRIVKRTMDCVLSNNADIIIIAWTNPARTDFIDKHGIFSAWPERNTSIMEPNRKRIIDLITQNYQKDFTNWYHREWLRQVILLQSFLKVTNTKYVMVQSHYSQWNNRAYERKNVDLMDQIDKTYFLGWPYDGFVEWTYDCKEGPGGHFLQQGHQKIADKIYEYIRSFGWVS